MTTSLSSLLTKQQTIVAPGVFDGLSARLVEQAGFSAIYASGGAISRSCGYPDLAIITAGDVFRRVEQIVDVTNIPVIADADTGFADVAATVQRFEAIGAAAIHIEDQVFPKRCGHLDGKTLISTSDMVKKIKAAKAAQTNPDFMLIARTDAIAVEGFAKAIERAKAYMAAGADMMFVEAPETEQQIEDIAEQVPGLKLINMFYGGKTPLLSAEKLATLGFNLVIIPSDLQRAAIHAMQQTLSAIKDEGDSHRMQQQMASFKERETIVDTANYLDKLKNYEQR